MNTSDNEHQLYLLSNEIFEYQKKIKDCKQDIKDNEEYIKDSFVTVREIIKELEGNSSSDSSEIIAKYSYLLNK